MDLTLVITLRTSYPGDLSLTPASISFRQTLSPSPRQGQNHKRLLPYWAWSRKRTDHLQVVNVTFSGFIQLPIAHLEVAGEPGIL